MQNRELADENLAELKPPTHKIIMFDLGNVFLAAKHSITYEYLERLGIPMDRALRYYQIPEYKDFSKGRITDQQFYKAVKKLLGSSDISYEQVREAHNLHIYGVTPGMTDLLQKLSNSFEGSIVFATDTNTWQTQRQQEFIDLTGYRVFASNEIGMLKGEPELVDSKGHKRSFYLTILEDLRTKPEEILFIDDSVEKIDRARSYGISAIKFENQQQLQTKLSQKKLL